MVQAPRAGGCLITEQTLINHFHQPLLFTALKFGRGNKSVVGMVSSEGESFAFRSPVAVDGPVEVRRQSEGCAVLIWMPAVCDAEDPGALTCFFTHPYPPSLIAPPSQSWMTGVETEMRATLAAVMKEGVWNYSKLSRPRWILDSLGMITLAGSQVRAQGGMVGQPSTAAEPLHFAAHAPFLTPAFPLTQAISRTTPSLLQKHTTSERNRSGGRGRPRTSSAASARATSTP